MSSKSTSRTLPDARNARPVIIMGPTAAGKTALSLRLAGTFQGEIINADSRQIYLGMDVGTDKRGSRVLGVGSRDSPILVEGIPHYLIDILTPDQRYSAAEFCADARLMIADIHRRGKWPIVVGGTGFYVRSLTGEQALPRVPADHAFRAWAEQQPRETLVNELRKQAPDLFAKVDSLKNRRRVTRYLEIARGREGPRSRESGSAKSEPTPSILLPPPSSVLKLALVPPKEQLLQRIEERVDAQLREGLIDEVRRLVSRYGEEAPGLQAVAYRQVFPLLRGEATLAQTRESIIRVTRDYMRRQLLWLKKEPNLLCAQNSAEAFRAVTEWLKEKRGSI